MRLQEQPFQVLRILLERCGKVVSREELKSALWSADTFVDFDDGLNTAVKKIRDVLGDSAEQIRYIETIPGKGYRFKYPVETSRVPEAVPDNGNRALTGVNSPPPAVVSGRTLSRRALLAASGAFAVMGVLAAIGMARWRERWLGHTAAPPIRSLVVLPLANLSGDPEQEYFADGMTEALITDLSQVSQLRVISRTSAMHYRGTDKTLPAIARELNIDAVIEGSVQRSANRVRVTARLIRVQTDTPVWTRLYERDARDVLLMQSELARAIVNEIEVQLTATERQHLANAHVVNPQAHEAYLLGIYHSSKEIAPPSPKASTISSVRFIYRF